MLVLRSSEVSQNLHGNQVSWRPATEFSTQAQTPRAGRPRPSASIGRSPLDMFWTHLCGNHWYLTHCISTRGPTKRVAVPKSVRAVQHVGQDVKTAVRMHREALCGNHVSRVPRHRRDTFSVDNLTHWLISTQLSTSTSMYGSPVAFPKARNGPRSGSRGSNQCL